MRRDHHHPTAFTVWLTGLSAAGKTTLAGLLTDDLRGLGVPLELLDGDAVRANLSPDLGFDREARDVNVRRLAWLSQRFNAHGVTAVVAAISPFREARDAARRTVEEVAPFVEVHVHATVETCMGRDPKGLYRRAIAGEIPDFTGVSSPYEAPLRAEVVIDTERIPADDAAVAVLAHLRRAGLLP